jgi:putative DNA primase/helicase
MIGTPLQAYYDDKVVTPPDVLSVQPEGIPEELKRRPQWVVWKMAKRRNGKWTKEPYDARTGRKASSTDLTSWGSFEDALDALDRYDGIGFVLSSGDPYVGVDLDGCVDPETGEIESWATRIVEALDSYTEVSPSGKGLHIVARGEIPANGKRGHVEMYSAKRFFTMTGHALSGGVR